jgi:hypothetical protein
VLVLGGHRAQRGRGRGARRVRGGRSVACAAADEDLGLLREVRVGIGVGDGFCASSGVVWVREGDEERLCGDCRGEGAADEAALGDACLAENAAEEAVREGERGGGQGRQGEDVRG